MNEIIQEEPSIKGKVIEKMNHRLSWKMKMVHSMSFQKEVEYSDSYGAMVKGDIVVVYYDGTLLESWPLQMHHVYAVTLETPAVRR